MAGATIVRWLLGPLVENGLPFVLYLASVAASTYWAGWRAGVAATVVSELAGSYFFADPAGSFGIRGPQDVVSAVVFIVAATVVVGALMAEKRARWRALGQERRLRAEQEERARLEGELEEARRLESLGRLAGGVAHDFNNLLTVILGSCELLRRELPGDDTLGAIDLAARRGSSLTRQLLSLARRQMMHIAPLSPNAAVEETVRLAGRLLPENIHIQMKRHPDPWLFEADSAQVQQLLLNLTTNARDALPDGGTIHIETDNVTLDERFARRNPEVAPGEYVRIRVQDDGAGIAPELQRRIFEPFFTTKRTGEGTGLGLAVAYGVVKQLRGHILVRSTPGQGSTFDVYWPRAQAGHESPPEADIPIERLPPRSPLSVMLVEDEELVRRTTADLLRRLGHSVIEASNGAEALMVSRTRGEQTIDVLVTDVVMPWMNGRDLARRLQATRPGLGVVFISGYTENVILRDGVIMPDIVLVKKPFTSAELEDALRKVTRAVANTA
jgi:signal transduction histidine kinase/CheY-like chemotaxis protein